MAARPTHVPCPACAGRQSSLLEKVGRYHHLVVLAVEKNPSSAFWPGLAVLLQEVKSFLTTAGLQRVALQRISRKKGYCAICGNRGKLEV